ncbi:DUF58 domain-containing protein [Tautonia sociabilis]|uniref:DUF58 domain-containing protein n=1 Tax=Tautonia sociabilis TaxID=2080755 RepID=A0A432MLY9_9BACT|nr:DUF58 domain-containing protein [Tautonia sociabilis]RUL88146.1 DUF58 domain-containing protein [Tautonia sociabilis]
MARSPFGKIARAAGAALRPSQTLRWTVEGAGYIAVWFILLGTGLYQQINLVLLIAGLAAGPIVGSIFVSYAVLRGLKVVRRAPPYVFAGAPLVIDYVLENRHRWRDALAMTTVDLLSPDEPGTPSARELYPRVFFPRVAARDRLRRPWRGQAPARGRYRYSSIELVTRSPFGLRERRVTIEAPGSLVVYPSVGTLTRRWRRVFREATETRRGRRHDRSAQQQEYHGLRDYRPGDSPRWIHWRTSARVGQPMVKEFEQQSDQDLAVLLDPWLPRTKATAEQREAVERAIRFCATVCLETCRSSGRRLLLGWTGPAPEVRHGPASIRLLHELLEELALLRPSPEGHLGGLLDALPASMLRDAMLLVVSTRPINLAEEYERSARLNESTGLRLTGRVLQLDASRGDLDDYIRFDGGAAVTPTGPLTDRAPDDDRPLSDSDSDSDSEANANADTDSPDASVPSREMTR